jgi:hypothetical protein
MGNRANNAPVAPVTRTNTMHKNRFEPLAEQGSGTCERGSERHSFGSLSGASGTHSSAKNNRGRDPIPLTPEILHLLDRLEPDKGKQARLLTEHMAGQRTLPSTEAELQTHLERRAAMDIKRQQVAAEAAAKAAADQDKAGHEAALAAHVGQQAIATTLATGATSEDAIVARMAALMAALGAGDTVPMQVKNTRRHNKRKEPRSGWNRSSYTMQSNKNNNTREQREATHSGPGLLETQQLFTHTTIPQHHNHHNHMHTKIYTGPGQ